jgi:hypothetical protein
MSDSLSVAQFGAGEPSNGHTPCPECGTAGKPDNGSPRILSHTDTPPGCRTYTWSSGGAFIARDIHPKSVRDARSDAIDARLRKLNPFRRGR